MIYKPGSFKERISEAQALYKIRTEKLVFFKNSLSSGKIPKDEKLYFAYSGKYGNGVVICSHLEDNNQYYIRSYYIKNG